MKDTPDFMDSLECRAEDGITPYGINYEFFIISVCVGLFYDSRVILRDYSHFYAIFRIFSPINPHKHLL